MSSETKVRTDISSFECKINNDVKNFLDNKAIQFEQSQKSKTYFLMDADRLSEGDFAVLAYFAVALKVLKISDLEMSNRAIKELDGFSPKIAGERIADFPVYLIGQLAKNDAYKDAISGDVIIDNAMSIISGAQKKVGGRVVLVECENVPYLISFYQRKGFKVIRQDTDKYIQMIRMIA